MHIAHSNISKPVQPEIKERTPYEQFEYEMALKFYKAALKELEPRIKEIQKTFPGWVPTFKLGNK